MLLFHPYFGLRLFVVVVVARRLLLSEWRVLHLSVRLQIVEDSRSRCDIIQIVC